MPGNVCLRCRALLARSVHQRLIQSSIARGYNTAEGPKDYLGTNFKDDAPAPQESEKDRFRPRSVKLHGTRIVTPLPAKPWDSLIKIRRLPSVPRDPLPPPTVDVEELLAKPSWSLRSLLPSKEDGDSGEITRAQLHHLCRLSALPIPTDSLEESKSIRTLQTQLHFLKEIQKVDTEGIEPLRSIRDETQHADSAAMIGLDTEEIQEALAKEEYKGRNKRPRRRAGAPIDAEGVGDWDVFSTAEDKVELGGAKYFVVRGAGGVGEVASSEIEEGAPGLEIVEEVAASNDTAGSTIGEGQVSWEVLEELSPANDVRVVESNNMDEASGLKDEGIDGSSTEWEGRQSSVIVEVQGSTVEGESTNPEVEGHDSDVDSAPLGQTSPDEIEKKEG
jgi:Asp-tRNA(Asn)/Glu-tRNA(Gln) amidotransferase C subunit